MHMIIMAVPDQDSWIKKLRGCFQMELRNGKVYAWGGLWG